MSDPVTVALDAMGGDHAPAETVAGALAAVSAGGVRVLLCGRTEAIERELGAQRRDDIIVVEAPDVIGFADEPAFAVRAKPNSSLVTSCRLVREGTAAAAVSAGSTGAMMAAALVLLRRVPGVSRPAVAQPLPSVGSPVVLIDCGANADCRPENLLQFAHMGAAFSSSVLGIAAPRVGLLTIGEEPGKGNALVSAAYALLAADDRISFTGNIEGRDLTQGCVDVAVCDGFTGNVVLKAMEGTARWLFDEMRTAATSSVRGRVGGLLLRSALRPLRARVDPETYGGAYLVGLRGLVVIAHGSTHRKGIANAISYAAAGVRSGVVDSVSERLGHARARSAS